MHDQAQHLFHSESFTVSIVSTASLLGCAANANSHGKRALRVQVSLVKMTIVAATLKTEIRQDTVQALNQTASLAGRSAGGPAAAAALMPYRLILANRLAEYEQVEAASQQCSALAAAMSAAGGKLPGGLLVTRSLVNELQLRLQTHAQVHRASSSLVPVVLDRRHAIIFVCSIGNQQSRRAGGRSDEIVRQ